MKDKISLLLLNLPWHLKVQNSIEMNSKRDFDLQDLGSGYKKKAFYYFWIFEKRAQDRESLHFKVRPSRLLREFFFFFTKLQQLERSTSFFTVNIKIVFTWFSVFVVVKWNYILIVFDYNSVVFTMLRALDHFQPFQLLYIFLFKTIILLNFFAYNNYYNIQIL